MIYQITGISENILTITRKSDRYKKKQKQIYIHKKYNKLTHMNYVELQEKLGLCKAIKKNVKLT